MSALIIFLKKIRWVFISLGIILFITAYARLILYFVNKYPRNSDGIITLMILGLVLGCPILVGICKGLKDLLNWLKRSWTEAKNEAERKQKVQGLEDHPSPRQNDNPNSNAVGPVESINSRLLVMDPFRPRARNLQTKAMNCISIVRIIFPEVSDGLLQQYATDLMRLSDTFINSTLQNLSRLNRTTQAVERSKEEKTAYVSVIEQASQSQPEPEKSLSRYDIAKKQVENE
jgi:hypothetical protein